MNGDRPGKPLKPPLEAPEVDKQLGRLALYWGGRTKRKGAFIPFTCARTHTYPHAHTHTHTPTCMHTRTRTHTHTNTHIRARTHTRVHTHAGAAHRSRRPSHRLALCLIIVLPPSHWDLLIGFFQTSNLR